MVHSTPKRVLRVSDTIAAIEGAQVHATSAAGKLIVTLEASTADEMIGKVRRIERIDGVLGAALTYECCDTLASMNEVICDDDDAQGIR